MLPSPAPTILCERATAMAIVMAMVALLGVFAMGIWVFFASKALSDDIANNRIERQNQILMLQQELIKHSKQPCGP